MAEGAMYVDGAARIGRTFGLARNRSLRSRGVD